MPSNTYLSPSCAPLTRPPAPSPRAPPLAQLRFLRRQPQRACAALVQDMESFSVGLVRHLIEEFGLNEKDFILVMEVKN